MIFDCKLKKIPFSNNVAMLMTVTEGKESFYSAFDTGIINTPENWENLKNLSLMFKSGMQNIILMAKEKGIINGWEKVDSRCDKEAWRSA